MLKYAGLPAGSRQAHAFSYLDFNEAALRFGKVGGFAHLHTLIQRLRAESGDGGSRAPGPPIWEVVAEYLRSEDVAAISKLNTPVLKGVAGNPGLSNYSGRIKE